MCSKSKNSLISKFFIFSVILMLIVSCSNPNEIILQEDSINLKSVAESYETKITWSKEIEKDRLSQKIPSVNGIEKSIKITPMNFLFSLEEEKIEPIYPEIPGIGKINISELTKSQFEVLDLFCSSLIEGKFAEQFVSPDSFYTLVLFSYDLTKYSFVFSSYIAGEPFFEDEHNVEIPVRLYLKEESESENKEKENDVKTPEEKYLDISLFLNYQNNKWLISQIVYDMEK